jgi:hypothetical protein
MMLLSAHVGGEVSSIRSTRSTSACSIGRRIGFGLELIVDGLTQALRSATEKGPSGNGSVPRG